MTVKNKEIEEDIQYYAVKLYNAENYDSYNEYMIEFENSVSDLKEFFKSEVDYFIKLRAKESKDSKNIYFPEYVVYKNQNSKRLYTINFKY